MEYQPTISQYKATAKFHRRMEELFRSSGKMEDVKSAKKAAEILETKIKEMENLCQNEKPLPLS